MKQFLRRHQRLIPIIISVVLVAILVSYAPWADVWENLEKLSILTIIGLLLLSLAYYFTKAVRFWYMLQAINIHQPFKVVLLSYISAQPVTLLPAGEIYRSHTLKRHTGVPIEASIPQFTMQGLFEGISMTIVGVICALALGTLRLPALIAIGIVIGATIGIQAGFLEPILRAFNLLPFISISKHRIEKFSHDNKRMLSLQWFPLLLSLSLVTEAIGIGIAYLSVIGLHGSVNIFQAGFLYIVPVIVGFLSFLPGGLGASEQSAIGVLLLAGETIGIAVAATLIMRVSLVGTGVVYGVIAILISRKRLKKLVPDEVKDLAQKI